MAETLISPGVFATENDQSQITQGPITAGAAIIGPTVIGPVNTPTVVTSYSQYSSIFGTSFISGGFSQEYFTSIAALGYFNQGGTSLLVTRVVSGSYTHATASVSSQLTATSGGFSTASVNLTNTINATGSIAINGINFQFVTASVANTSTTIYVPTGSTIAAAFGNFTTSVNASQSYYSYNVSASGTSPNLVLTSLLGGTAGNYYNVISGSTTTYFTGGSDLTSFVLETLSSGIVADNSYNAFNATNGILPSGSSVNVKYEIVSSNSGSGLFTLVIRRGDDYQNARTVLETWTNLSLDPNQNNYITYVIGDQTQVLSQDPSTGNYYLQTTGSYANKSKYVRVKSVNSPTPNYFGANGQPQAQFTASLPLVGSGSYNGAFGGSQGPLWGSINEQLNVYENIPNTVSSISTPNTNIQGVHPSDYDAVINLLGNKDAYQFNSIYAPGLTVQNAPAEINSLLSLGSTRGDNIAVVDMVGYGQNIGTVTAASVGLDSSYGATYWPWVQINSPATGKLHFVPASTLIPAVYEYNDKVSAAWFAPAGFTRGGLSTVIQPERKLSIDDRNTLYAAKVNPIANFPGVGTVIYGQKTLQQAASALDRVNVRRLLITLKSYITQVANNLVFEPNTQVTWNKFLNAVNPYLATVQQRQGLYSYNVVMDNTNNTPDSIDRNILNGSIYIQPTRVAEFVYLSFNITNTGASFA